MLISSLYPVVLSRKGDSFEDVITLEVLQSLDLILQNKTTLDAFETALSKEIPEMSSLPSLGEYLQIWLKCEYYRDVPSKQLETEITTSAKLLELNRATNIINIQYEVYRVLTSHIFPLFKKTKKYQELLKHVVRQQIYTNRILQTSFTLESDFEYSIMGQSFDLLTNSTLIPPNQSIANSRHKSFSILNRFGTPN